VYGLGARLTVPSGSALCRYSDGGSLSDTQILIGLGTE